MADYAPKPALIAILYLYVLLMAEIWELENGWEEEWILGQSLSFSNAIARFSNH